MRSRKIFLNIVTNTIMNFSNSLLAFIVRRVFQQHLGAEILGINSVFSNILAFLSLSELGIGTIIAVYLYKPLAEKDNGKVSAYMWLLRKAYFSIGIGIFTIGIVLMPLVPFILTVGEDNLYIYSAFFLYLINVAAGYFFSYKKILLIADQRAYMTQIISTILKFLINIIYIVVLIVVENYQFYLIIGIIGNIVENIIISIVCRKKYPYISQKTEIVTSQDKADIIKKLKGMLCLRVGNHLINGVDNIIISKCISTVTVAYYSNYYLIINSLDSVCSGVAASICSSLGNLIYTDRKKLDTCLKKIMLVQYFLFGVTAPSFYILSTDFVKLFLGPESVMNGQVVFFIAIVYYLNGYSNGLDALRKTLGFYEKDKVINLLVPVINLIISFSLVKQIGVIGVLIGTVFCYIIQKIIVLPIYTSREVKEFSVFNYYVTFLQHMTLTIIFGLIVYQIVAIIPINNYLLWFLKAFLSVLLLLTLNLLIFCRSDNFRGLLKNVQMAFEKSTK